ncbi:MAG TPA: hypothetical protein PK643_20240, partial [Saprospiraceae bacterium]|nr:hypothetical protein [Saprospiraceae bacterium]
SAIESNEIKATFLSFTFDLQDESIKLFGFFQVINPDFIRGSMHWLSFWQIRLIRPLLGGDQNDDE